jgi:hypothetical protein
MSGAAGWWNMQPDQVGSIASTEACDISSGMCHFNGPLAPRKSATITPDDARALGHSPAILTNGQTLSRE